jgi:hypothetical protein
MMEIHWLVDSCLIAFIAGTLAYHVFGKDR